MRFGAHYTDDEPSAALAFRAPGHPWNGVLEMQQVTTITNASAQSLCDYLKASMLGASHEDALAAAGMVAVPGWQDEAATSPANSPRRAEPKQRRMPRLRIGKGAANLAPTVEVLGQIFCQTIDELKAAEGQLRERADVYSMRSALYEVMLALMTARDEAEALRAGKAAA